MSAEIHTLVSADKTKAKLVIKVDGKTALETEIDDDEITEGIQRLGNANASLNGGPPLTLDPVVRLKEVDHPRWIIPRYTDGGDRLLIIRHPAMGWTSFRFSQEEANEIAEWLTKPLENRPNRATPTSKP